MYYITLKSVKKNLGLFNLEFQDLIIAGIVIFCTVVFFIINYQTIALIILALGAFALIPTDFSKCNRLYKVVHLFASFLLRNKNYYYY